MDIDIVNSVPLLPCYPSVTERYFTERFCHESIDNVDIRDHCVLFHSNRICLIKLADTHPVIKDAQTIKHINFKVSKNTDRLLNKVSGKGKKGGHVLQRNSVLCKIECEDGTVYPVYSCVSGRLIEINEDLISNPTLLSKNQGDNFIAIILPKIAMIDSWKDSMFKENHNLEK